MSKFLNHIDGILRVGLGALVMAGLLLFFIQPEYELLRHSHPHSLLLPFFTGFLSVGLYAALLYLGFRGGRWMPIHFKNQFRGCFLKHNDRVSLEVPHENLSYQGRVLRFKDANARREYLVGLSERALFKLDVLAKCTFWLTGNKLTLIDLGGGIYTSAPTYCIKQ